MPQPPSRLATVLTFLSSPETSYTLFIIFIFANAILLAFLFLMRKHRIVERKLPTLDGEVGLRVGIYCADAGHQRAW